MVKCFSKYIWTGIPKQNFFEYGTNSNEINISSICLHLGLPRAKRSLPPVYLNEIAHDQCLEKYNPPGGNHTEYCLPATKPEYCSELSWDEIQNSFDGEDCPSNIPPVIGGINGLPPAYQHVRGHQKCLKEHYSAGETHTKLCLPESRPNKCRKGAYKKLVEQIFL